VDWLLAAARRVARIERPRNYGPCSDRRGFIRRIYRLPPAHLARWRRIEGASREVIPNIHPIARNGSYPASAVQAGYHMADTSRPISAETFESACWSA
jgi:hypothetical protein